MNRSTVLPINWIGTIQHYDHKHDKVVEGSIHLERYRRYRRVLCDLWNSSSRL